MQNQDFGKPSRLQSPLALVCGATLCTLLWGSAFPAIKIGYRLLSIDAGNAAAQILFAGLRFSLAGLLTLLFGSLLCRRPLLPQRSMLPAIFNLSLTQTSLHYLFFYLGLARTSAVKSSILDSTGTFLTILFACYLFRTEKMTVRKLLGCAAGFAGVIVVNLAPTAAVFSFSPFGEGFLLLASVCAALSTCLIRRYTAQYNAFLLCGWQFLLGGLMLVAAGALAGGRLSFTPSAALLLGYLALLSATAYSLWALLLRHHPTSRVSVYGFLIPAFGALLSALLPGESLSSLGLRLPLALLLVCAGIYFASHTQAKQEVS